jgi:predicted secreted protein
MPSSGRLPGWSIVGVQLSVLVVLAACGNGGQVQVFTEEDSEIAVAAGERLRIEFPVSPGVGDDWSLVGEPDAAIAHLLEEGFESEAADDIVGGEGIEYFLFEAAAPGTTEIVLEYCYRGCGGEGVELERTRTFELVVN